MIPFICATMLISQNSKIFNLLMWREWDIPMGSLVWMKYAPYSWASE